MRAIKFRAFDKDKGEMVYCDNKHYWAFFNSPDSIGYGLYHRNDGHRVISGEYNPPVMQFTGLTDKNGKEIYEGDIIRHGESIRFIEVRSCNYLATRVEKTETILLSFCKAPEVIGNIYSNPELFTPKAKH